MEDKPIVIMKANRKLHTRFQLVQISMSINNLQWCWDFSTTMRYINRHYLSIYLLSIYLTVMHNSPFIGFSEVQIVNNLQWLIPNLTDWFLLVRYDWIQECTVPCQQHQNYNWVVCVRKHETAQSIVSVSSCTVNKQINGNYVTLLVLLHLLKQAHIQVSNSYRKIFFN